MIELRCPSKKHGVLDLGDAIEIKCDSRFCGAHRGVVVLHRFNKHNGELLETLRFQDPGKEVNNNGAQHHPASVRTA